MTKRMLIDATHPEETRAVVLDGHHLVDFDFETSTKRQLKGNIYLAKITRVEPSLQAAFVEYGGNRHGFLAFSEIHPDYFQIPQADRAALDEVEREAAEKVAASADVEAAPATNGAANGGGGGGGEHRQAVNGEANGNGHAHAAEAPTLIGGDTADAEADEERAALQDEQAKRRARLLRSYKIQEVVKRRQIMLVQVVKEERGNKGAALTTYLSLAGRYCVLMPNTARGGGISRKISDAADRKKLKQIAQELEVPNGMGLIIRTAGQERSKAEIRRDYEYLLRLWNEIRETTLQSMAPKLIYEEGDLIKRALRDLYSRDIEEVLVEGEEGYKSARRLMTMLMPSRARLVKKYEDEVPLFFRHRVEEQLDGMHSPVVELHSGGSIVLHTTEALTAIDVNSGRSTRERHIDETAVKTNLEAADEIARQLRLRDVAGLIVVDFIDMAENRHQRAVEKRLRDALKLDRARIQIGRISQFGLLELSRQRLRASLLELSSQPCPVCIGTGVVRSTEGSALHALRAIQGEGLRRDAAAIRLELPAEVALYVLNNKRDALSRLEQRYGMRVQVAVHPAMHPGDMRFELLERRDRHAEAAETPQHQQPAAAAADEERAAAPERRERQPQQQRQPARPQQQRHDQQQRAAAAAERDEPQPPRDRQQDDEEPTPRAEAAGQGGEEELRRRRRRRRRRRGRGEAGTGVGAEAGYQAELAAGGEGGPEGDGEFEDEGGDEEPSSEVTAPPGPAGEPERPAVEVAPAALVVEAAAEAGLDAADLAEAGVPAAAADSAEGEEGPRRRRRSRRGTGRKRGAEDAGEASVAAVASGEDPSSAVATDADGVLPDESVVPVTAEAPSVAADGATAAGLGGEALAAVAPSDMAGEVLDPSGGRLADDAEPSDLPVEPGAEEPDAEGPETGEPAEADDEAAPGEVFTGLPPAVEVPEPTASEEVEVPEHEVPERTVPDPVEVRSVELADEGQPEGGLPSAEPPVPEHRQTPDEVAAEGGEVALPPSVAAGLAANEATPGPSVVDPDVVARANEPPPPPAGGGNGSAAAGHTGNGTAEAGPAPADAPAEEATPAEPQPVRTGWWSRFVRS